MSNITIPTLAEVQEHFAKAKEVRCLATGNPVGVHRISSFEYSEDKGWTSIGGNVTFWLNNEYADITRKKCDKCKNCNCK